MEFSRIDSNQKFGKQALMTCEVKERGKEGTQRATLYSLDPQNASDRNDVRYSKQTFCIASDFERQQYEKFPQKEFYVVNNDKTGEVVSCAEISHHYSPMLNEKGGVYTLIEEAKLNKKYDNGEKPLLAYIARQAVDKYEEAVIGACEESALENFEGDNFTKLRTGEIVAPKENFMKIMKQADEDCSTEYLV